MSCDRNDDMIALCPNPYRDIRLDYTREVMQILNKEGFATCICPVFADPGEKVLPDDLVYSPLKDAAGCSLAVVIGGDGTILAVARDLIDSAMPLFGINLGTKGFLSTTDPSEPDCAELLIRAAKKDLLMCSRMMLDVEVFRDEQCIFSNYALNDAVLRGYIDCIQTDIYINDVMIKSYFGDGVILSTPSGSTGYSMSAGGPIVEPSANNYIITPICAHSLSARSFVLTTKKQIKVIVERLHGRRAYISVDGGNPMELMNGDCIRIRKSDKYFHILERDSFSYFENISNKLY